MRGLADGGGRDRAVAGSSIAPLDIREEAVARACHELRGPLTAAALGVELGLAREALSPAQLRAIDSELGRATLALDDLVERGPTDGWRRAQLEEVDLGELLRTRSQRWRPTAAEAASSCACYCAAGAAAGVR